MLRLRRLTCTDAKNGITSVGYPRDNGDYVSVVGSGAVHTEPCGRGTGSRRRDRSRPFAATRCAIRLLHGTDDDHVLVQMSRGSAASARAAGDDVTLHELAGCEHFALIDPKSSGWPMVLNAFKETARL